MITSAPLASTVRPSADRKAASAPARPGATWRLLAPGDEVTLGGSEAYAIVHLSHGRAWLTDLADGAQMLDDASALVLSRCGTGPARPN